MRTSLTATEASEAGMLAFPFPSRQAGNRQVAISLARVMLFRVLDSVQELGAYYTVLISLARVMLFRGQKTSTNKRKEKTVLISLARVMLFRAYWHKNLELKISVS